jgi:hypothetical protein
MHIIFERKNGKYVDTDGNTVSTETIFSNEHHIEGDYGWVGEKIPEHVKKETRKWVEEYFTKKQYL